MPTYDVRARAQAARQLGLKSKGGKGQAITITTSAAGTFNPATDTTTGGTPVVRTGSGIVLEYTTFIRSGVRNEKGTLIAAGDKQMLLAALADDGSPLTSPKVNDTATVEDGTVYTITAVAPLSPAGLPIMYDCNIRGSK